MPGFQINGDSQQHDNGDAADYPHKAFTDLQQAKAVVNSKASDLERRFGKPTREALAQSVSEYPLFSLFASVLVLLSVFPVVSFLGFALFAGAIIVASSLLFFCFWTALIVGSAALVLSGVLAFCLSISAFVTAAAAGGLLVYRSFTLIKAKGSLIAGVKATIAEAKAYISGSASSGNASLMDKSEAVDINAENRFLPRNAEGEILPEKATLGEVMTVKSE